MAAAPNMVIDVAGLPAVRELIAELESERDSARHVAVTLEQENAHLNGLLTALADDLADMNAINAIVVGQWPAALDAITWAEERS